MKKLTILFSLVLGLSSLTAQSLSTQVLDDSVYHCEYQVPYVQVAATGGTPPYTYTWVPQAGLVDPYTDHTAITSTNYSRYWVLVRDASGAAVYDSVEFLMGPNISLDLGPDTTTCQSSLVLDCGVPISAGFYSNWSNGFQGCNPTVNTSGIYHFGLGHPASGCNWSDSIQVTFAAPFVDLGPMDTFICDSLVLGTPALPPSYLYLWNTGDTSSFIIVTQPGTYWVQVTDGANGCTATDSITVHAAPLCVWPGDTDNDGIANNQDLLNIGLTFGATGSARSHPNIGWNAQVGQSWNQVLTSGVDYVYSDTDGDGAITDDDTLAIVLNYGQTHSKTSSGSSSFTDPVLYLDVSALPTVLLAGDSIELPIHLGTDSIPVSGAYGIAFTINYDSSLVDSGSAQIQVMNSWLGNNLLDLDMDFYGDAKVEVGITRTDHVSQNGYGQIGKFIFVMVDDIAKRAILDTLQLSFSDILLVDQNGQAIPVRSQEASLSVGEIANSLESENSLAISLYPNPVTNELWIRNEVATNGRGTVFLYDLTGKKLLEERYLQDQHKIELGSLARGAYLLQVVSDNGKQFSTKVWKQ